MDKAIQDMDLASFGHESYITLSSKIQMLSVIRFIIFKQTSHLHSYPPTPAHLAFLVSTLRVPGLSEETESVAGSKAVLAAAPSLVVLHELSIYFLPENSQSVPLGFYPCLTFS